MTTTYTVRFNKNWYREPVTNKASCKWEVIELFDGEFSAVCTSFATKDEALESARIRQADEDAGVTENGIPTDPTIRAAMLR